MNLKNYLTPAQVKAYATTPKKALAISKKHWWQNSQLTQEQLVKVCSSNRTVSGKHCGLCAYYKCSNCLLRGNHTCSYENSPFDLAHSADIVFYMSPTEANYKAFIEAAKNMHKVLCGLEKAK